ncbi:MAG: TolC family protein [Gammaproteobacteria bacterium]|nr:MAG: TolC family protein [Gammaproteobacteria bacterium]
MLVFRRLAHVAKRVIVNPMHSMAPGLLFALGVLWPWPVLAEPQFQQVVELAMERHPRAPVADAVREIGKGYRHQARSPVGGVPAAGLLYRDDRAGSDLGFREWEANLDLPLWRPGQRQVRERLGQSYQALGTAQLRSLRWKVAGEVLMRGYEVLLARSDLEQARIQEESARLLTHDVQRRVEAGELAASDLLLAQQELLRRELGRQQAEERMQTANLAWRTLTGIAEVPALPAPERAEMPAGPREDHPSLAEARERAAQAQIQREDTELGGGGPPVLTLYAKRDRGFTGEPYDTSIGLGISVPFAADAGVAPELARAQAAVVNEQAALAVAERELRRALEQAVVEWRQAREAFALGRSQRTLAAKRYRMVTRAFELGETDLFRLLQAREQAALAERDLLRLQLRRDYALARIAHLYGDLP